MPSSSPGSDRRGWLAGKRSITERPATVAARRRIGHWEVDTMLGGGQAGACVFSLVERKTGYLVLGHLRARTPAALNARAIALIQAQRRPVRTITADNALRPVSSRRAGRAEAGALVAHGFQQYSRPARSGPTCPAVFHVARFPC